MTKTGSGVEGVAKFNAYGAAGLTFTAAILGVLSLVLPWWTGASTIGEVADPMSQRATATLWSFDLGVAVPNPEDITTTIIESRTVTWADACAAADMSATGEPGACSMVRAIRGFSILTMFFGAAAAGALLVAVRVSHLVLLPGAILASLAGFCAFVGVGLGMATNTSGLTGFGCGSLLAASMMGFSGLAFSLYAATNAMKLAEGEETRIPRQKRAEEARNKERDLAMQLEAGARRGRRHSSESSGSGTGTEGSGKRAPVMLKKVLFWSQEKGADGEQIPTKMLEAAFREIDASGDGSIDSDELVESLEACGLKVTQATVEVVMKEIDKNCSGDIDIHEFVEFFRNLEELSRFDVKSQQQAQFLTFICNICFVIHIIIVSVLLMSFINLEGNGEDDNYLIMKNMLFAFSAVLAFLLMFVICLPAIRLTLGQSLAQWQRAYEAEVSKRLKNKKKGNDANTQPGVSNLRGAAWAADSHVNPATQHVPVNAALHGASYRVSRRAQPALEDPFGQTGEATLRAADSRQDIDQQMYNDDGPGRTSAAQPLGHSNDAIDRYDPTAYRYAAMLAVEARTASSFSPMQVRDLDVPPEMLATTNQPGMLALTGGGMH
mmetsp:Transcript_87079/g.224252  ORF Transcript_87079/g.224252 Transcript_87079/m.224252 type:complete len:608 (+) Transcript_87079:140-1963(+)